MKSLALLPIAGALSLYGSAFFGLWTAPGLENLPTYQNLTKKSSSWKPSAEPEPLAGMIPVTEEHAFQPEGVVFDWGTRPVIMLPTLDPAKAIMKAKAANLAIQKKAKAIPRRAHVAAPPQIPPTVTPSYHASRSRSSGESTRASASGDVAGARSRKTSAQRGSAVRLARASRSAKRAAVRTSVRR